MSPPKRRVGELVPARARGAVMRSIQRGVNRLGYEIVPWADGITEDEARRARLLAATGVDLVLDVGANAGQYASKLRRGGYQGRIVSFEPLSRAFAQLSAASVSDPSWECRRLALGATDGETEINVSENSYSSSLLEMEERHVESAPESRYVGTEKIKTARLDSIWAELVRNGERPFLKLDVQGFELEVLRGAETSLPETLGVQAELSLVPLYRDGPVFRDVIDYLEGRGFRLAGLEGGHDDRRTGEMLQADGIFIRA